MEGFKLSEQTLFEPLSLLLISLVPRSYSQKKGPSIFDALEIKLVPPRFNSASRCLGKDMNYVDGCFIF